MAQGKGFMRKVDFGPMTTHTEQQATASRQGSYNTNAELQKRLGEMTSNGELLSHELMELQKQQQQTAEIQSKIRLVLKTEGLDTSDQLLAVERKTKKLNMQISAHVKAFDHPQQVHDHPAGQPKSSWRKVASRWKAKLQAKLRLGGSTIIGSQLVQVLIFGVGIIGLFVLLLTQLNSRRPLKCSGSSRSMQEGWTADQRYAAHQRAL
jgi:hypothetical protein